MDVRFEWDGSKAASNAVKHGITFEEAQTVFADPTAVIVPDEWHSDVEEREIIIGHSDQQRLLFVVFVERVVRTVQIISARSATRKERLDYEQQFHP